MNHQIKYQQDLYKYSNIYTSTLLITFVGRLIYELYIFSKYSFNFDNTTTLLLFILLAFFLFDNSKIYAKLNYLKSLENDTEKNRN